MPDPACHLPVGLAGLRGEELVELGRAAVAEIIDVFGIRCLELHAGAGDVFRGVGDK